MNGRLMGISMVNKKGGGPLPANQLAGQGGLVANSLPPRPLSAKGLANGRYVLKTAVGPECVLAAIKL